MNVYRDLLIFFLVLALAIIFFLGCALAHDYDRPELADWFMSLHSDGGTPCCDGKDAVHVPAEDWGTQNIKGFPYWVVIDGQKYDVPDKAVISKPNKAGDARVWSYPTWKEGGIRTETIRCFMPGTLT